MKKVFFLSLWLIGTSLFAQDTSIPDISSVSLGWSSGSTWMTLLGVLFFGFLYVGLPLLFYCISSYSLSLLNKYYHKKKSSRISWIPFVRYYDFVKQATKSPKKAFVVTLLPWILTVWSLVILIILGIIENISQNMSEALYALTNTMVVLTLVWGVAIVAMSIWRAFIISKYVQGDTTTALGLSTYTTLVLWYIALDRVYKKTDSIGITGFTVLGLMVCFYGAVFIMLGAPAVLSYLWV